VKTQNQLKATDTRFKTPLLFLTASLFLVACSSSSDPRPTSVKEHVELVCDEVWNEVKTNETVEVSALLLGVPTVNLPTSRIKKNSSAKDICECTKGMMVERSKGGSKIDDNIFLSTRAEAVYKGLKKGSFDELSAENQALFGMMTSTLLMYSAKCIFDAASKGN
jgi:hypothetical protein